MSHEVLMPQLGMAQNSAIIVSWNKTVGEPVTEGELLLEVETDKAVMEVESRHNGFVTAILSGAGSDVPIGDVIAMISASADDAVVVTKQTDPSTAAQKTTDAAVAASSATISIKSTQKNNADTAPAQTDTALNNNHTILASPKAKRLAYERGVDLQRLIESGAVPPFHAADIPRSSDQLTGSDQVIAMLQATVDLTGIQDFIEWSNEGNGANKGEGESSSSLSTQQMLAAFCASGMPSISSGNGITLRVTDHLDVVRYWMVGGTGLSAVVQVDNAAHWDIDIIDLSQTMIVDYLPATGPSSITRQVTLVVCSDPSASQQSVNLRLYFPASSMSTIAAANWLQGIAKRCVNPLLQLI